MGISYLTKQVCRWHVFRNMAIYTEMAHTAHKTTQKTQLQLLLTIMLVYIKLIDNVWGMRLPTHSVFQFWIQTSIFSWIYRELKLELQYQINFDDSYKDPYQELAPACTKQFEPSVCDESPASHSRHSPDSQLSVPPYWQKCSAK